MEDQQAETVAVKPLWRRVADFPLVAMLLAIAIFVLAYAAPVLLVRALPPMDQLSTLSILAILQIGLLFAAYKLLIRHLGRERRDDLPLAGAPKGLALGLVGGFILFSAVVGVAAVADVYNIIGEGSTAALLTALIAIAIIPGFTEELMFRGILFRWLEEFGGSWFALALTSALFGLGHIFNSGATVFSSFAIAMEAGILLGAAYMLTRNLWVPIGLHAAWNFTQGEIWDVPVSGFDQNGLVEARLSGPEILSGGTFGLEASIFALILCTAAGVWLLVLAIRRGQLVRAYWVRRRLAAPAPEGGGVQEV